MKPTKPNDRPKRLRLKKQKIKILEQKKLDDVAGGIGKPCHDSFTH